MRANILAGMPVKQSDPNEVMETYCRMLYIIGTYASVVQGKAKDLCAELLEHPDLYRHEVKRDSKAALKACEDMVRFIGSLAGRDGQYNDWLDITDMMEQSVETDLMKLYFALDNAVHRARFEPHRVATLSLLTLNLACQLVSVVETCEEALQEMSPRLRMAGGIVPASRNIRSLLQEVAWRLVPREVCQTCKNDTPTRMGFDIVFSKLTNLQTIDDMAVEQAKKYGVAFRKEDQVAGSNNRVPWTAFQIRVLLQNYGKYPDEELALKLGRTAGAIARRANILHIRKDMTDTERYALEVEMKKKKCGTK